jgi:hypothetical protein
MTHHIRLSEPAHSILRKGGVFVPSPLALDKNFTPDEKYQRLLTLYYIKAGTKAVIPGAHTGEFALNDLNIFDGWLNIVKEMTTNYGKNMLLMAAVGGRDALKQAKLAAQYGYDIAMVAPTAFSTLDDDGVIDLFSQIAAIIPTFGFELQKAIPGSREFSIELWEKIFEISYGAKGASFDTYRSIKMMQAAANSIKKEDLVMLTGNDDRIVTDLLARFDFHGKKMVSDISYKGGLLGHFATDTHAVVSWTDSIRKFKNTGNWDFTLSQEQLVHAVNHCNMVLFDALGNFENSVWGVKYRLTALGLLPGPYCVHENGRAGQAEKIDRIYGQYPVLTDNAFLADQLEWMKKEVNLIGE